MRLSVLATAGKSRCSRWPLLLVAIALPATPALSQQRELDFGGIQRTRYESLDGQILPDLDERDAVLALQTSLRFEARMNRLSFVGEILDSRAELNDVGSFINNTVVNTLEPLQAYVAWTVRDAEHPSVERALRVGRMTLDLGKRRIVSRNRFRNTVNNFVGAEWQRRSDDKGTLRAFYFVPMRHLPTDRASLLDNELELDRAARDTAVLGVFYLLPPLRGGAFLEAYALDYQAETGDPANGADFLSLGARIYRLPQPGRWHYEVEAIVQGGESGANVGAVPRSDLRHRALFTHFELGYALDGPWTTNITFQYDRADGDEDPLDERNERFNTLFGDRRFDFGPTGIFGPFQRSNLATPGIRVTVTPTPRWQGMLSYRSMRLASRTDEWVGTGLRDPSGAAGRSLGVQLEASATWTVIPG
ncbi:MAG TPA: alginate export family protein, partial [Gammaproteobacteria bacterium]|nr:alginate export family protein [Gammaproteobacteria bacterium]